MRDIKQDNIEIEQLLKNVINSSEDINGMVRIFVRVKGGTPAAGGIINYQVNDGQSKGNKFISLNCDDGKEATYGGFYDVFNKDLKNKAIFENVKDTLDQVIDGYHIVTFGYGYSGSGKTYTLINNKGDDKGILIEAIKYYTEEKKQKVELESIKELYNKSFTPKGSDFGIETNTYEYKINDINTDLLKEKEKGKELESFIPKNKDNTLEYVLSSVVNKTPIDIENINIESIDRILKLIELYRKKEKRIKATINNPESSRGHLFITLKIGNGKLTICDMAGRENPVDIWTKTCMDITTGQLHPSEDYSIAKKILYVGTQSDTSIQTITGLTLFNFMNDGGNFDTNRIYKDFFRENIIVENIKKQKYIEMIKINLNTFYETCKEAHYINETLHHMVSYFNELKGVNTTFTPGVYESKTYIPENVIKQIDGTWKKVIGMYPILNELKGENTTKPTKFCLFACVRQEKQKKFKDASISTLEYAETLTTNKPNDEIKNEQVAKRCKPSYADIASAIASNTAIKNKQNYNANRSSDTSIVKKVPGGKTIRIKNINKANKTQKNKKRRRKTTKQNTTKSNEEMINENVL